MAPDTVLLRGASVVNEGGVQVQDVYLQGGRIHTLGVNLHKVADLTVDAGGKLLFPGLIDDQVHFREPGLTHKGDIFTESGAAVAGGITSYMEMPNTVPPATNAALLQDKFERASRTSIANYSFYLGATNHNLQDVLQLTPGQAPGIKVFMASSTGDLLVDDDAALEALFRQCPHLIATHCEDETIIRANAAAYQARYGQDAPASVHPQIRTEEACYASSSKAVALARRYGTRLHVLHISTARELSLFEPGFDLANKRITAEACIHHLWFTDADYARLGNRIKWNPAIKTAADRDALWKGIQEGRLDVIATDHAPHTLEEKELPYFKAPSGGPLVQHSLLALLESAHLGHISLPGIAHHTAHAVADCFGVLHRGYIREGYWADLVLVDPHTPTPVTPQSLRYKCGWSPFEGFTFNHSISHTFVNGQLAYHAGQLNTAVRGQALQFKIH